MNGESKDFPPHDKRIKPAWDKTTDKYSLILGGYVIYEFKSERHFRDFSILCHCMEQPLEKTETPTETPKG